MTLEMRAAGAYHSLVNPIVEEIFANFISNAIKYSSENTCIIIDVVDSNYQWRVEVTDQGEGVPDELKSHVFERFKRVHKKGVKGTGLGLAIVKRIAEIMGGEVGVEDNPAGLGSVFWVKFRKHDPYTDSSLPISEDDIGCVSEPSAKRKLLVH